jgi:putative phage-type endonuclease
MTKSKEWHAQRRLGIGGSDATIIMGGDEERITRMAQEKLGLAEPEDLSAVLPVQIGILTEPLNREWFTRETGKEVTTADCEGLMSFTEPFMRANLDGRVAGEDAIFEAKHVNQFSSVEETESRYYWQLQHYLAVTGEPLAYLSVFIGTLNWEHAEVRRDGNDIAHLIEREKEFWGFIERGEIPPIHAPTPAPAHDDMREADMTGSNLWADSAAVFLESADAAKLFAGAKRELKEMVEPDVRLASGHGVAAKRAKNGAITVRIKR